MRKLASLIFAAGLMFPVMASIVACHSADSKSDARAAAVPSAKVATAQRGDISHVLTLAGQFQPYQVVDVHPKVSGYMSRINVDIGDIVHQGQTLAVLEVPELKAELEQTVFQLQQTKEEITRVSFAKMPSVFIFIAFQIARVGRSERLLTVKKSGTLFNSSAGWSFGEGQPSSVLACEHEASLARRPRRRRRGRPQPHAGRGTPGLCPPS